MMHTLHIAVSDSTAVNDVAEWMHWLDISEPWELWWIALGVLAQLVFFGRWVVQWIESERRGESYMPTIFWWCSLIGASMLLIYFIGRREPVGVLGQLVGWTVYLRNLYLIRIGRRDSGTMTE